MQSTTALTSLTLAALAMPGLAEARPVTLTAQLTDYGGEGAYLAAYVTDAQGAYQGTLWLAGPEAKWWSHLGDWYRASGGAVPDGVTGASVGSGRNLTVTVDLADALIDAGYQIRLDSAVEDMGEFAADAVVPLTSASAGKAVAGNGFVRSLSWR
ncbi:DUF2271 domain-containing protein [Paracoccus contaminans]|uniref:Tat pathway signal protein n=1 Tax=Paracoccus contaminans TaxID=1945662 RepID=A0A1W6CXY7_9RHOB|nr:DUF2271 domain-containing protein [Paracoccus contaminans]ARJ69724.1 Tat pathway signal protein [Paracoccus contaminans]